MNSNCYYILNIELNYLLCISKENNDGEFEIYFDDCPHKKNIYAMDLVNILTVIKPMELVDMGRCPFLTFLQILQLCAYKSTVMRRNDLLIIESTRIYVVLVQKICIILHISPPGAMLLSKQIFYYFHRLGSDDIAMKRQYLHECVQLSHFEHN